jgi:hypothetical protein
VDRAAWRGGCASGPWGRGDVVDGLQPVIARGLVRAAEQWADAGCCRGVGGWLCPSKGRCSRAAEWVPRAVQVLPSGSSEWWRVLLAFVGWCFGWSLLLYRLTRLSVCLHVRACAACDTRQPGGGGMRRPRCRRGLVGGPHGCCCEGLCYASRFFFALAANMSRPDHHDPAPPAAACTSPRHARYLWLPPSIYIYVPLHSYL